MKLYSVIFIGFAAMAFQAPVFAQDYYVPIKKELEPMARLPMPAFQMNDESITYTLPKDIAGRDVNVELKRENPGQNFPRLFSGPLATVSCMGDDTLPACVVQHKDLNIDRNQVAQFLGEKYRDPSRLAQAKAVSEAFISGNEPIGFISKRSIIPAKNAPTNWSVEMLQTNSDGSSLSVERRGNLNFTSDVNGRLELEGGGAFDVSQVNRHALHLSGVMNEDAQTVRWFDVFMSTDKATLSGTWGRYDAEGKPIVVGTINGKEIPNAPR